MCRPTDEAQPVPGLAPAGSERSAASFSLEVDGELFDVTDETTGASDYVWLSGPNEGYGFGESGLPGRSLEEHRQAIRAFLSDIDPTTGFLRE